MVLECAYDGGGVISFTQYFLDGSNWENVQCPVSSVVAVINGVSLQSAV